MTKALIKTVTIIIGASMMVIVVLWAVVLAIVPRTINAKGL